MDKNENGYPNIDNSGNGGSVGGVTDVLPDRNGGGCGNGCGCRPNGGSVGGAGNGFTCGGDGSCLDLKPLAYLYAPDQRFRMLYSADDALRHGTLFEELYKPMEVYGNEQS